MRHDQRTMAMLWLLAAVILLTSFTAGCVPQAHLNTPVRMGTERNGIYQRLYGGSHYMNPYNRT